MTTCSKRAFCASSSTALISASSRAIFVSSSRSSTCVHTQVFVTLISYACIVHTYLQLHTYICIHLVINVVSHVPGLGSNMYIKIQYITNTVQMYILMYVCIVCAFVEQYNLSYPNGLFIRINLQILYFSSRYKTQSN